MRENAPASPTSSVVLARRSRWRRRLIIIGVLGLAGLLGWWFVPTTVYFVNGFSFPLRVALDGGESFEIEPRSYSQMTLVGGNHRAEFTFANGESDFVEFSVHRSLFPSTVHVLNPGTGAVLYTHEISYGNVPLLEVPESEFFMGNSFQTFTGINFAFVEAPDEIETAAGSWRSTVHKTRLDFTSCPGDSADFSADVVLTHCENHLLKEATPGEESLSMYQTAASRFNANDRRRRFLTEHGISLDN